MEETEVQNQENQEDQEVGTPEIEGQEPQPGAKGVPDIAQKAARLEREREDLRKEIEDLRAENALYREAPDLPDQPPVQQPPAQQFPPEMQGLMRELASLESQGYHGVTNFIRQQMQREAQQGQVLPTMMQELGQLRSERLQQHQFKLWDQSLTLAKKGIDLSGEPPEVVNLLDAMFFQTYGGQLIDPRTGRLAQDPRTLASHYKAVYKVYTDSHEVYHQQKLKDQGGKLSAAKGVAPEKGSGPAGTASPTKKYPGPEEVRREAEKRGISPDQLITELDAKFLG